MGEDFPLAAGDTAMPAMISLCAGGLVRTWTDSDSSLWRVQEAEFLHDVQGTGVIGRTLREERRFREAALLSEHRGSGVCSQLSAQFPANHAVVTVIRRGASNEAPRGPSAPTRTVHTGCERSIADTKS
jgi:hypothetical protein